MRILVWFIGYPLMLTWMVICGFTGMILSVIFRAPELTLSFVPGKMWAPLTLFLLGIRTKRKGVENVDADTPTIYVVNHASFLDIPVSVMSIPVNLNFIAKKELKNTPIIGWYISATRQIFVDRKNKEKAMESMREAARRIKAGKSVLSYAEGTRSKDGHVKLFRRGAFLIAKEGNIRIVPVGIEGAFECLPPKHFLVKPGTIHINIGEGFYPEDYPDASVEELAEIARQKVIALKEEVK
jgi:1-acyl-sn-glycerol-3-phosphate acyltransferase